MINIPDIDRAFFFFFLYSHNNYMDNYNTKSKGAWKYIDRAIGISLLYYFLNKKK